MIKLAGAKREHKKNIIKLKLILHCEGHWKMYLKCVSDNEIKNWKKNLQGAVGGC